MTTFFLWMAIITIILVIYGIVLWRRTKHHYRFHARLSIMFLLFVLIPTIPLTLFVSLLLTQSTQIFMLPGIEEALVESLQSIRGQLESNGQQFMDSIEKSDTVTPQMLNNDRVNYIAVMKLEQDQVVLVNAVNHSASQSFNVPIVTAAEFTSILQGETKSKLRRFENHYLFETYKVLEQSTILVACHQVDISVCRAIDCISFALRNYNSLSLLKDTLVEQGLIWAAAVIFILMLTVLAVYSARRFAKGISEPIHTLAQTMHRVAEGDLDQQVEVQAKDEIAYLVTSFNKMISDLKQSRDQLIRAERVAAWRDVARQISHEIKNPLTPIQINLFKLRKSLPGNYPGKTDIDKSLATIEEEIESMRRLADEFSEFARLPKVNLKKESLNEIIRTSITLFEAESRKVKFNHDLDEAIPLMHLDRDQIRRAINNLIKNAIDASELGETVAIETRYQAETGNVMLVIKDHGRGMDKETLEHALQPYFTTKKHGTGLGLFMVHRILTDHGARLEITSQEGKGTTVTILFQ